MPRCIGRFQIRRELGEGAFGKVYEAYDPQLDRAVAIKVAKLGRGDSDSRIKRFLREAKAAAGLRHPHIVPVYEFGQEADIFYIVSSFINGQTLQADRKSGAAPDLRRAARIIGQIADALAYAHAQGIVHRDVKPANIMLDDKDEPMLMDFGLATRQDEAEKLTHAGTVLGTPLYMSPEQARGQGADAGPASDQYSLGVMLYEMIAGKPPFSGTPELVMFHHVETEPASPRRRNAAISRDLETICLKCLNKKPAVRYASAADLADDLKRFQAGEPIKARRVGAVERGWRWARRNPILAAVSLLALIGLLAAASLGFVIAERTKAIAAADKANALADRMRLGQSLLAQAQAERVAGNRWAALERIAEAAEIERTPELRQEAIQAITASGVRLIREVPTKTDFGEKPEEVVKQRLGTLAPAHLERSGNPRTILTSLTNQAKGTETHLGDPFCRPNHWPQFLVVKDGDNVTKVCYWQWTEKKDTFVDLPASAFSGVMRQSTDGTWVAYRDVIEADVVRLWDCRRARPHGKLEGRGVAALLHATRYPGAEFSPDNRLLATAHWRAGGFALQIDEVGSCLPVKSVPGVAPILWLSDGRHLLSHGRSVTGQKDDGTPWPVKREFQETSIRMPFAQVWEVAASVPTYRRNAAISRLVFNHDHTRLIVDDTLWEVFQSERGIALRQTEVEVAGGALGFRGKELWAAYLPAKPANDWQESVPILCRLAVGPLSATGFGGPVAGLNSILAGTTFPEWHPPKLVRLTPQGDTILPQPPDYSVQLGHAWKTVWQTKRSEHTKHILHTPLMRTTRVSWRPESAVALAQAKVGARTWDYHTFPSLKGGWSTGTMLGLSACDGWDASTGRTVNESEIRKIPALPEADPASAYTGDGKHFITPEPFKLVVRNGDDGGIVRSFGFQGLVPCDRFSWSVDGRYFVAVSSDRNASDTDKPRPGEYSAPEYGTTKALILDLQSDEVRSLTGPRSEWSAIALAAGAETVYTGGEDGLLRIRDVNSGRELARWQAHAAAVTAMTFSTDGKLLVSGARDGTIRVWNIPWIRSELVKLGLDW